MQNLSRFWHRCAVSLGVCGLLVSGALAVGTDSFGAGVISIRTASAAAQYREYQGLPTRTAPKRPPAFAELEMRAPDTTGNLPLRLARETAFAALYQEDGGLGPEGYYHGSWDRAGVGLEIHLKGNIRGVFLMYNRTPW
jgi:hypothetical protein